jgi:hypothetical protein
MPVYNTQCRGCGRCADRKLTFAQYDLAKEDQLRLDCACGGQVELVFDPSEVSFVLKDGESGGFVSKALRENAYRKRRCETMAQRERDHVRPNRLQPNFQGQTTSTWEEAKDAAYQSTYDKVKREHGSKVAADAAAKSAKTYDRQISGS